MDKKAIRDLMQRAGFTWSQRESQYNLVRVERLIHIARNEALEEAAKVCDNAAKEPSTLWEEPGCWAHSSEYCAAKIRALKEQK